MRGGDVLALVLGLVLALGIIIGYIWSLFKMRAQCRSMSRRVRISNAAPYRYCMQQAIRANEGEGRRWRQRASQDRTRPRAREIRGVLPVAPPALVEEQQQQTERPPAIMPPSITITPPALESDPPSYCPITRPERSQPPPPRYTLEDEEAYANGHVQTMHEPRTSLEVLLPVHLRARTYMSLLAADEEDAYPLPPPYGYSTEGEGPPPAYDYLAQGGNWNTSEEEQGQGTVATSILGTMVGWVGRRIVRTRGAQQEEAVLARGGDEEEVIPSGWRETAAAAAGGSGPWPSDP